MKQEGHALMAWLSWAALKFDGATAIADYLVQLVSGFTYCQECNMEVQSFLVIPEDDYEMLRDRYVMPDYGGSPPIVFDPGTHLYGIPMVGMDLIRLACIEADDGRLFDMDCDLLGPWLGDDAVDIRKADKAGGSHQAYPFDHTSESSSTPWLNIFDVATYFAKKFFDTLKPSNNNQDLRWRQLYLLGRLLHLVQDAYTLHHALVEAHDEKCLGIFCRGVDSGHAGHESAMLQLQEEVCRADDFGLVDKAKADLNQSECLAAMGKDYESREFGIYEVHPEQFFNPQKAKPYDWLSVDPSVDSNGCHQHIHTSDREFHHAWIDYNLHGVIRFAGADGLWEHKTSGHGDVLDTDSGNGVLSVKGASPGDKMLLTFWGIENAKPLGVNLANCGWESQPLHVENSDGSEGPQEGVALTLTALIQGSFDIVTEGFELGEELDTAWTYVKVGDDPPFDAKASRVVALQKAVSTGAGFLSCAAGLMGVSAERGDELAGVTAVKGVVQNFAYKWGAEKVRGVPADLNDHSPLGSAKDASDPFIGFGRKVPWEMDMPALPPDNKMDAIVMHAWPGQWVGAVFSNVPDWSTGGYERYFVAGVKLHSSHGFPLDSTRTTYVARVCYWSEEGNTWIVLGRLRLDSTEERLITIPLRRFKNKLPSKWRLDAERLYVAGGRFPAKKERWHLAWVWPQVGLLPSPHTR